MVALQKVAWLEVCVAGTSIVLASALIPWLGHGATGAFGILGGLGLSAVFLRGKANEIVIDERDQEIERLSRSRGIFVAWLFSYFVLLGLILWAWKTQQPTISTLLLTWVMWLQFALCYLVKGTSTLMTYRKQNSATSV